MIKGITASQILGLALIIAPWLTGYATNPPAMWTSVILGALIAIVSGYKARVHDLARWEYWVAGLAGLLVIILSVTPYNLTGMAMWTNIILGGLVLILAGYKLFLAGPETV